MTTVEVIPVGEAEVVAVSDPAALGWSDDPAQADANTEKTAIAGSILFILSPHAN
jgi:hypothetical protein